MFTYVARGKNNVAVAFQSELNFDEVVDLVKREKGKDGYWQCGPVLISQPEIMCGSDFLDSGLMLV